MLPPQDQFTASDLLPAQDPAEEREFQGLVREFVPGADSGEISKALLQALSRQCDTTDLRQVLADVVRLLMAKS